MGKGRRPIPISRADIERAMAHTKSNNGAAKYLGISLWTYSRAASRYTNEEGVTLFKSHANKSGKGIPKLTSRKNGEPLLMAKSDKNCTFIFIGNMYPQNSILQKL